MKMRTLMYGLLLGLLTVGFTGCESSSQKGTATAGAAGTAGAVDAAQATQTGVVEHTVHDASPASATVPSTTQATVPARPRPRRVVDQGGSKAMGLRTQKPGFVISPYAMYDEPIDVSGLPAGTEVKCPYTGKIFIVP
ncbi:hypothetical protein QPK87_36060 [Kamptonema cortianum]|nr:hypothetical protein [Kamptonema cortianum]MDL5050052.1 hypothetical protein [Oscillatoria amoena NRMC-F 0135]